MNYIDLRAKVKVSPMPRLPSLPDLDQAQTSRRNSNHLHSTSGGITVEY